jgi:hypothetical protein
LIFQFNFKAIIDEHHPKDSSIFICFEGANGITQATPLAFREYSFKYSLKSFRKNKKSL